MTRVLWNSWFVSHDNVFGFLWIFRKHSPVDIASVSKIRIVTFVSSLLQNWGNKVFSLTLKLKINFNWGIENCELNILWFIFKVFGKISHQGDWVVNEISILSNDPDHSSSCFWVVKSFQIFAKVLNDGFISIWVLSENILDDDNSLLHHIVDLGFDQLM